MFHYIQIKALATILIAVTAVGLWYGHVRPTPVTNPTNSTVNTVVSPDNKSTSASRRTNKSAPVNNSISNITPQLPPIPNIIQPPVIIPSTNLQWGIELPDWEPAALTNFEKLVGKPTNIYATFVHWGNEKDFPTLYSSVVRDAGKTLLIYWEDKDYNHDVPNDPKYSYDAILRGDWDSYFQEFATAAKAYGGPVILIPFDEMNDNVAPWSGTTNNNTPAKHIAAYRYIHQFFSSASNVKFGWAVNSESVPDITGNQIKDYYPGSAYVDYVGVDGFNFGRPWASFDQIFSPPLTTLAKYSKPIYIFSMACAAGTKKAAWITDGLGSAIKKYPGVVGWVWFNENKEKDWRVNSDTASLAAFKAILP